jgi:hypothetical protein
MTSEAFVDPALPAPERVHESPSVMVQTLSMYRLDPEEDVRIVVSWLTSLQSSRGWWSACCGRFRWRRGVEV